MISSDEEALICDFAETYHIYDYRSLPVKLVATLAAGLRDTSRIAMKTTEGKASTTNTILAVIADRLGMLQLGLFGVEAPSIFEVLYGIESEKSKSKVQAFEDGDAFMKAWREINGG